MSLTAEFIAVADQRKDQSPLDVTAFQEAMSAAAINGANFFSGELHRGGSGTFGIVARDETAWRSYWETLGQSAPGPLPRGVMAVMQAEFGYKEARVLRPTSVFVDDSGCNVEWQRLHLDHEPGAASRFAVLLVPDGEVGEQNYSNELMSRILQKERDLREEVSQMAGRGTQTPVRAVPRVRFRVPS